MLKWMIVAAAATLPVVGKSYTVVNGIRYRVTVLDARTAVVARKSFLVSASLDEKDAMRTAVKQVTGCALYDEQWTPNAHLAGRLNCQP